MKIRILKVVPIAMLLFTHMGGSSQTNSKSPATDDFDSSYYRSYASQITARFYFSQKFTNLILRDKERNIDLDYKPNTSLNMGIGATYKSLTLNLAYGFPFLNKDGGKGETKYLDLQAHLYGRKSTIDLAGQFYRGFYLSPRGKAAGNNSYYLRPDLRVREYGVSYQYMFNYRRFSYRAAFVQNEWQQKSAGTFLLGGESYAGWATADSSIYPSVISPPGSPQATEVRFFEIGPNAGYAYTLVIKRSFFLTGAFSVSLGYNRTEYLNNGESTVSNGLSPNTFLRFVAGYNSERNAVSLTFTNNKMSVLTDNSKSLSFNTGNIRLNFVRRFEPGPKTRRVLGKLDRWVK